MLHGRFVNTSVAEGGKKHMECPVVVELSFVELKAYKGGEGRKEGSLLRPSMVRRGTLGHSWPFF